MGVFSISGGLSVSLGDAYLVLVLSELDVFVELEVSELALSFLFELVDVDWLSSLSFEDEVEIELLSDPLVLSDDEFVFFDPLALSGAAAAVGVSPVNWTNLCAVGLTVGGVTEVGFDGVFDPSTSNVATLGILILPSEPIYLLKW